MKISMIQGWSKYNKKEMGFFNPISFFLSINPSIKHKRFDRFLSNFIGNVVCNSFNQHFFFLPCLFYCLARFDKPNLELLELVYRPQQPKPVMPTVMAVTMVEYA